MERQHYFIEDSHYYPSFNYTPFQANKQDGMNEARKVIAKQFPAMYIAVDKLPYVEKSYRYIKVSQCFNCFFTNLFLLTDNFNLNDVDQSCNGTETY